MRDEQASTASLGIAMGFRDHRLLKDKLDGVEQKNNLGHIIMDLCGALPEQRASAAKYKDRALFRPVLSQMDPWRPMATCGMYVSSHIEILIFAILIFAYLNTIAPPLSTENRTTT